MSTINLPKVRACSDITFRVSLKDNDVAIDWTSLSDVKALIYHDAQKAVAGRCVVAVDEEDSTVLVCTYAATKPQYLGINSIVIRCKYMGREKTYDKPAVDIVARTAEATGQTQISDPEVDVDIDVEEVSTSLLDNAIAAAFDAAADAEEAANLVPLQVLQDCVTATGQAQEATTAANNAADAANAAGITQVEASVDDNVGTPSVDVDLTNKKLTLGFHNMKGIQGETGATPDISIGEVTTGAAGSQAAATMTGTAAAPVLNLTIPKGDKGDQGNSGYTGAAGELEVVNNLTDGGAAKALSAEMGKTLEGEVSQLEAKVDGNKAEFDNTIQDLNGETLYIADADGNVVAKIDDDGIKSIEVEAQGKKLSDLPTGILSDFYENALYVTDGNGNVIARIAADGLAVTNFSSPSIQGDDWFHKKIATYGDSITALNGGDFSLPYSDNDTRAKWANKVARYFSFANIFNRGIGSTCFKYRSNGGQVAWCKTATGEYVGRDDLYNYDNYEGNVTIPADCTPIRGDGSSWLRITTMFPASIKDTIDVILVMFHNDFHYDMVTQVEWIPNDVTDPEWAASDEYETLGGDYNIDCVEGGVASVVMKLQAWMPQAKIVLMTPISGVYATADGLDGDFDNTEAEKMKKLADIVLDIAFRMSIPSINVYGTDGINSLNRTEYIADTIHPYTDAGCKQIARAVIGGMKGILPELDY